MPEIVPGVTRPPGLRLGLVATRAATVWWPALQEAPGLLPLWMEVATDPPETLRHAVARRLREEAVDAVLLAVPAPTQNLLAEEVTVAGAFLFLPPPEVLAADRRHSLLDAVAVDPLEMHPVLDAAGQAILDGELGEPQVLRWKTQLLGPAWDGLGTGIWTATEASRLLQDPLVHRFHLASAWFGPIEDVFCQVGLRSLICTWKHGSHDEYGVHEITWSPDARPPGQGYPLDERIEATGTCGILWVEQVVSRWREGPQWRLKHGSRLVTRDFGPQAEMPAVLAATAAQLPGWYRAKAASFEHRQGLGASARLVDACLRSLGDREHGDPIPAGTPGRRIRLTV